jgi:hypothetical protein
MIADNFGSLTRLGQSLFDNFRSGRGLDDSLGLGTALTGGASSAGQIANGSAGGSATSSGDNGAGTGGGRHGAASVLDLSGRLQAGANGRAASGTDDDAANAATGGSGAVTATGTSKDSKDDPIEAAFQLLQRDLTSMLGMVGYSDDQASQGAAALTDAARKAYAEGNAFSISAVAIDTLEHYSQGPNGSMYMGTLSAKSLELYVDPATGTFSAKAVSVEIQQVAAQQTQAGGSQSADGSGNTIDNLPVYTPTFTIPQNEGKGLDPAELVKKLRKMMEELEKVRQAKAEAEQEQLQAAAKKAVQQDPKLASQINVTAMAGATHQPSDGVYMAIRLDASVPIFGTPKDIEKGEGDVKVPKVNVVT